MKKKNALKQMKVLRESMMRIEEGSDVITSAEGSIQQSDLDSLIMSVVTKFNLDPALLAEIRALVIDDYIESDISQVTADDIVEIMDASGI